MSTRIMKHNPAFLSREELVASFVARQEELAFVLDHIADNTGASSQHLLIVAPRGMGKTTLVLRAAEAVRTDARLSAIWFPLVYAEETYEVTAAGELWLEGLRHLGEQTKNAELLEAHRELRRERDEQRLYDRALGRLLQFAEEHDKRILLVVENLHMLLDEQISKADAWKLRKTLQTERRLLLLATATASFDAIDNEEQAFFDQFRVYRLEPLDLEGARQVWAHVAGVPVSVEHMRPLYILTGGNPRLLAILASFAGAMSLRALMGDLVRLVDDHTTYFKSNLDSLPAKERKVYVALADLWQPSTAREVAEQTRLSPSEVSALLNRLTQRGAVTTSGEERRRTYQLAERMYNIYHLLRRSGGDETRVRAVVDFMVGFYDPMSLGRVVRAIAEEGARLCEDERRDHLLVVEALLRRETNPRVRELWVKEARAHLESWPDTPDSLRMEMMRATGARGNTLLSAWGIPLPEIPGLWTDGIKAVKAILEAEPDINKTLDRILAEGNEAEAAVAGFYTMVVRSAGSALPLLQRSLEGRHTAPRRAFLLCCLGRCLMAGRHHVDAESAFREALTISPNEPGLVANLALLLSKDPHRSGDAEETARTAIGINASVDLAWRALFLAFQKMPGPDLSARAASYRPMLLGKETAPRDRAVAGLWAWFLGAKSPNARSIGEGLRAMWDAWNRGIRPAPLGAILLAIALESSSANETKRSQQVRELLAQFSTSFKQQDIHGAFGMLWESNDPRMHQLAVPHLPILLADHSMGDAVLPLVGLLVVLGRWEDAQPHLLRLIPMPSESAEAPKPGESILQLWVRIFIDAAATGRAREALDLLASSPLAAWLEPVVAALHAYLGQPHRAPMEVTEVGRDVVKRIRDRTSALRTRAKQTGAVSAESSSTPAKAPPRPKRSNRKKATPAPVHG